MQVAYIHFGFSIRKILTWGSFLLLGVSCEQQATHKPGSQTLFNLLPEESTGVDFANNLEFNADFNVYKYRNYYNGGGVALGDVNNDGFLDIYLTSNMAENKLYLHTGKGDIRYKDITAEAGVCGSAFWSTGVTMADVNGDGWLDIYVCNSGNLDGDLKQNELFINNGPDARGVVSFSERASEYKIADKGFSTHAAFLDFDKDGDLDLYLLNNSFRPISTFNLQVNERYERDSLGGDKLLRNEGGYFVDVTQQAGIYGSIIGFGMGITVGDFDNDNWPDMYVSNDFFERDYLYINNKDGTFRETLESQIKSISATSMGADAADLNNDGFLDIFVTDMLPKDEARLKTKTTFENWDKYQFNVAHDYYHQFTRNTLQMNQGKKPDGKNNFFSELGRLSGVEASDWSWGALIFDMENDGFKDIFVANGIYKDLTDQDYIQYISAESTRNEMTKNDVTNYEKLVDIIPSNPIPNAAFKNLNGSRFDNRAEEYGLSQPSFSNGSAYGDLDNDGDLDLVINNVNMPLFIYENRANQVFPEFSFLKCKLSGPVGNSLGIGAKITVWTPGGKYYQEVYPAKGFQSSVDPRPNFGLGITSGIDSLEVIWPDGNRSFLENVGVNQNLSISHAQSEPPMPAHVEDPRSKQVFSPTLKKFAGLYQHQENRFVDFDREGLIPFMRSTEGPKLAVSDINADGLDDFFIGGAKGFPSILLVQQKDGRFERSNIHLFEEDKEGEVVDAIFFDSDQDGDMDLYVVNGGNEFSNTSVSLRDILYVNNGNGMLTKSTQILPAGRFESTSCVKAADYDQDGDMDLFVGVRSVPGVYGIPCNGYLLENNNGEFTNITSQKAPDLLGYGMFTDAAWNDIDGDGDMDLITVGDWMPISVFENVGGKLINRTESSRLSETRGWWNTIESGDFDKDGDSDFVVGNHGINSRFRASPAQPISMYINDFDSNGKVEQIISTFNDSLSYPLALKHDLVKQMPHLRKKYLMYNSYALKTVAEIFSEEEWQGTKEYQVQTLQSVLLVNQGKWNFTSNPLPQEAQTTPIYAIAINDFNKDGFLDVVAGGNLYGVKPEYGRYDAGYGVFLRGSTNGFQAIPSVESGIWLEGEIRDLDILNDNTLLVARNNDNLEILSFGAD